MALSYIFQESLILSAFFPPPSQEAQSQKAGAQEEHAGGYRGGGQVAGGFTGVATEGVGQAAQVSVQGGIIIDVNTVLAEDVGDDGAAEFQALDLADIQSAARYIITIHKIHFLAVSDSNFAPGEIFVEP